MPDQTPAPTPEDLALDLGAVLAGVPGLLRADVPTRTHWQLSAAAWGRACAAACRRALAAEARAARLAALGDRLLRCAERELVPGAELAREWAEAREGV